MYELCLSMLRNICPPTSEQHENHWISRLIHNAQKAGLLLGMPLVLTVPVSYAYHRDSTKLPPPLRAFPQLSFLAIFRIFGLFPQLSTFHNFLFGCRTFSTTFILFSTTFVLIFHNFYLGFPQLSSWFSTTLVLLFHKIVACGAHFARQNPP